MSLANPLEALSEADLQELIRDRVAELQTIDYKKGLYLDSDPPRNEFRADISSFANASGGHLVIGMDEKDGFATDLCGMDIPNPEAFILRIEEVLQTKISPRIPGYAIRTLELASGKVAVVIRIPQSFAKPHQITVSKDDFQFWSRNSAGKYRLSIDQLRSIILQSDTMTERVKAFRLERVGNVIAGETPVPLQPGARVVIHMIPLSAVGTSSLYDIASLEKADASLTACPSATLGYWSTLRHNFDGILSVMQPNRDEGAYSYLQVFRNGILEGVEAQSINWSASSIPLNWSGHDEALLISTVERGMALQRHLGIEPPIVVYVTLVGVKGYIIYRGQWHFLGGGDKFDRDVLSLPDVLVEDYNMPALDVVRPLLDAVWNAGGYSRCLNINPDGKHVVPQ